MDPPPPSLSIPPPAPPSIPPPQPATVTTTITPTPTTNETPHLAPPPHPTSTISLPSYAEMIYSAITALKEQDGSSRIAIAKYIERAYPAPPEQKRGRGRPPKTKANGLPPTPPMLANGQPQTGLGSHVSVTSQTQSQLVGIPADPASTGRKGRGRPKKVVVTEAGPLVKKGRGRPPNSGPLGSKKSTGRPRKPKSLVGAKKSPAAVFSVASPKPRGRPRKGATPTASATGAVVMVQAKQPGRPAQVPGVMKLKPRKSSGRPVGRPRKVNAVIFTRIRV
ncbi:hypothetical protein OIU84_001870 [Salix udensis]|uniref:H15 domain-containing protein n=1 Tax=Salix udensis TaxID=889485 RepID=A0AAD6K9H6_9ROSI|nr:hypothetical protein OIU84_001870 [Salix udensis]